MYRGPDHPDGSPTFNIFDPVRAQYFKISWGESVVMNFFKPGMSLNDLHAEIENHSTLKVTKEEIKTFFEDALRNNLLAVVRPSDELLKESRRTQVSFFKTILYKYLYFRIPLFRPDEFLKATMPLVRPLVSGPAFILYALCTILGFFFLIDRFSEYTHTFTYFFNFNGFLAYLIGIGIVKVVHEFAHAYTAAYYGIHIPNMGIAIIIMWPVLYTDVTDSWKLAKREQRLAISAAGITAELVLAGLCTLGWVIAPPGIFQSLCFVISSITWVSTLVINLNPAMRYDGYYLLADLWGVDNLQPRAFALTRWWIRRYVLGMQVPPPEEEALAQGLTTGLVLYSLFTWIYRIVLYTAVAIFIYYRFTKVLGIILFVVEIAVFLIMPIVSEIAEISRLKGYKGKLINLTATITVLTALALWFILPLPHTEHFPAVTTGGREQTLYAPDNVIVDKIYINRGSRVKSGQSLVELSSKKIDNELEDALIRLELVQKEIDIIEQSDADRPYLAEKKAERASIMEEITRFENQKKGLDLTASINGTVENWDETIQENQTLAKGKNLGKIADLTNMKLVAFVPESLINIVQLGQEIHFLPKGGLTSYKGRVVLINPIRPAYLNYPALASIYNGALPVVEQNVGNGITKLKMIDAYYQVDIQLEKNEPPLRFGQSGSVDVEGPSRSLLYSVWTYIAGLFWRESGF